jgi:hypothetical protein
VTAFRPPGGGFCSGISLRRGNFPENTGGKQAGFPLQCGKSDPSALRSIHPKIVHEKADHGQTHDRRAIRQFQFPE